MENRDTGILIVGAGAAGVTAAIGLARRRIPVVVIEGAVYPGAENWSGAVYFCENLAREDILGEDLLAQTPVERRLARRGVLASNGALAAGFSVDSPSAFDHCYTVLRPVFDHDLAQKARLLGAEILPSTQALALLRDGDRVCGVLTDRGPITADAVFLAEGDASNLVSREGLELIPPGEGGLARPEFLQGIKEVLDLPAAEIERRFGLAPGEGAAFEILLRNPAWGGEEFPLNAGAFLYTNRSSLSLGLVAPLENLKRNPVPHNVLMEWLKSHPALRPLLEGAKPASFGAKLIRGGGYRQIPRLVLPGLAVGGAASGIGVDFPCPNYTGPATFMGATFAAAAERIRSEGGDFSREALERHYLDPVRQSVYWKDVEHLKDWPGYVSRTRQFFGRQVDLATGLAEALARPRRAGVPRLSRALRDLLPGDGRKPLRDDLRAAADALGLRRGLGRALLRASLAWTRNLATGWTPRPAPSGATLVPHLWTKEGTEGRRLAPLARYLGWKLRPGIAEAMHELYRNDGTPLDAKVPAMRRAILHSLHWLDLALLGGWAAVLALQGGVAALRDRLLRSRPPSGSPAWLDVPAPARELSATVEATDLDAKLAWITYRGDHRTHIHFHQAYDERGLPAPGGPSVFRVCPARVYKEEKREERSLPSVAVLHENCIRCETCWRADDRAVDWGRTRGQKLVFEAYTEADAWLRESREAASLCDSQREGSPEDSPSRPPEPVALPEERTRSFQVHLRRAVLHARAALRFGEHAPSVMSGADQHTFLQLAGESVDAMDAWTGELQAIDLPAGLQLRRDALLSWAALARTHLSSRRFFHAEADLRLLIEYHLPDLAARLGLAVPSPGALPPPAGTRRLALRAQLERELPRDAVAACEHALEPAGEARAVLLRLLAGLVQQATGSPAPPGSAARDATLEELVRCSPGLAVSLALQLQALDLLSLPGLQSDPPGALAEVREDVLLGRVTAGPLRGSFEQSGDGLISGRAEGVLLGGAGALLIPSSDGFLLIAPADAGVSAAIEGGLGLRAAGPGWIQLDGVAPRARFRGAPAGDWLRLRSGWDVVAIARGIALLLQERAFDHAGSRVQFPGLFQDFRGRDSIAKFGAVQAMLSGIVQGVEVLEALRGRVGAGRPAAALALGMLAPSPRSIAYLAGQVLGGTAYSEEDPVCRAFRDATALARMPLHCGAIEAEFGDRVLARAATEPGRWPTLSFKFAAAGARAAESEQAGPVLRRLDAALGELDARLAAASEEERRTWPRTLGRLALQVVAVRVLADRVLSLLGGGGDIALAAAALEALGERVVRKARLAAARIGDGLALQDLGARLLRGDGGDDAPLALSATYRDYLDDGRPFQSGDSLSAESDAGRLFATPELLAGDPGMSDLVASTRSRWRERFRPAGPGDASYPRLLERLHHIPLDDVGWMAEQGLFRSVIPGDFGGLGWKKAAYYAVCREMMRFGDPAQAIVLMGSLSIGTTPILIGLFEDIPEARKALGGVLDGKPDIQSWIARVRSERDGSPDSPESAERLRVLASEWSQAASSRALRSLLAEEGRMLQAAAAAPSGGERARLLGEWIERAGSIRSRARDRLADLARREAAHGFFLRLIASGKISAFALTEPSAGSDTARMRTRAERTSVAVDRDPRGFYWFTPDGAPASTRRTLFAYESFAFDGSSIAFTDSSGNRHPVQWRDYGETEAEDGLAVASPRGRERYVELEGERVPVHDVGRIEDAAAGPRYPYFRVRGAKMWITNASMAGVMILYARTAEGPTGFMLDAASEGLVVGGDEHKMGQRGSTTNELALDDVRIPVDQVIGMEGRGQENALETLNVGRTGLAVCCTALIRAVLDDVSRAFEQSPPSAGDLADAGRIALDLLKAESFAYQLAGLADHPLARSNRMESAMGKAFASEALHRVLTRAERMLDAGWALDSRELEKRRRDARVITIYEGTSEIQRFLVLRDLAGSPAPSGGAEPDPEQSLDADGPARRVLEAAAALRRDLGPRIWQQAHLQSFAFPLVDLAMEAATLRALGHRVGQAARLAPGGVADPRFEFLRLGLRLAAADCRRRTDEGLAVLDRERERIRLGRDPLHQAVADRALLRQGADGEGGTELRQPTLKEPVRIAVLVAPEPLLAPRPRVSGGRVREHAFELAARDRAVLRAALRLRDAGDAEISVFAAGRLAIIDCLEECIALGAGHAWLVDTGPKNLLAPDVAGAIADVILAREELSEQRYDLVLAHGDRMSLAAPLARRLRLPLVPGVAAVSIGDRVRGEPLLRFLRPGGSHLFEFPGRAMLLLEGQASAADAMFTAAGWRRARKERVKVIDFVPERSYEMRLALAGPGGPEPAGPGLAPGPGAWDPESAARRLVEEVGGSRGAGAGAVYDGPLERMPMRALLAGLGAVALVEAGPGGDLPGPARAAIRAAAALGSARNADWGVIALCASEDEDRLRELAGSLLDSGDRARIGILAWRELAGGTYLVRSQLIEGCLKGYDGPAFFPGELRLAALLSGEGRTLDRDRVALLDLVDRMDLRDGSCELSGLRGDGKLRFSFDIPVGDAACHAILASDFEAPASPGGRAHRVVLLDEIPMPGQQDVLAGLLKTAEREMGASLKDAEYIIDVGYGVGSRDGIEEVIEPLRDGLVRLGVRGVTLGATRKVTMDLGILPDSAQIGQTGTSVNPKILIAVGVSGAPQHIEYIGGRGVIFAFNRDPEAPIMTLNERRPRPLVVPVLGDLFVEVPRFLRALANHGGEAGA